MEGTPSGDGVECVYPFAARLSQYLNSSFHCAEPEVFPIVTTNLGTTSKKVTCVASGIPAPNVTLKTNDGAYVTEAVGGISVSVNVNISVSLLLPDTDIRKYHLVCIAVNSESTRQVSLELLDSDHPGKESIIVATAATTAAAAAAAAAATAAATTATATATSTAIMLTLYGIIL